MPTTGPSSPLDGLTVVVTGAEGPVGSGLARAIADAGGGVLVVGADGAVLERLVSELHGNGAPAVPFVCSFEALARGDGARRALNEAARSLGPPHGLVHACVAEPALEPVPFVEVSEERWDSAWELTMLATLRCFQAAYRSFDGRGGRILVVVPTVAMTGAAGLAPLAAAAEGQRLLAKSAARQWGRDGVTVNCLAPALSALEGRARIPAFDQDDGPGVDDGPVVDDSADPERERAGGEPVALAAPALGRRGDPRRDLGHLAVFLLGNPVPFLTGITLCADGGLWMAP